ESSGEHPPDVDEFTIAGLVPAEAELVPAPYVADCPAVFECRSFREVELGGRGNVFVIVEVLGVRVGSGLELEPGTFLADPRKLRPVARLAGELYALLGEVAA